MGPTVLLISYCPQSFYKLAESLIFSRGIFLPGEEVFKLVQVDTTRCFEDFLSNVKSNIIYYKDSFQNLALCYRYILDLVLRGNYTLNIQTRVKASINSLVWSKVMF